MFMSVVMSFIRIWLGLKHVYDSLFECFAIVFISLVYDLKQTNKQKPSTSLRSPEYDYDIAWTFCFFTIVMFYCLKSMSSFDWVHDIPGGGDFTSVALLCTSIISFMYQRSQTGVGTCFHYIQNAKDTIQLGASSPAMPKEESLFWLVSLRSSFLIPFSSCPALDIWACYLATYICSYKMLRIVI